MLQTSTPIMGAPWCYALGIRTLARFCPVTRHMQKHTETHMHTLTGWATKLPALGALPTSWRGNVILQKAQRLPPSSAPPEMCAMWCPRAQPRNARADCLSGGQGMHGTLRGSAGRARRERRPRAFATVVSRALRGTSPLSLLLENHTPPRLLGPSQVLSWIVLAWGALGASPVGLSITRNPDLPSRRDPRIPANTSPWGRPMYQQMSTPHAQHCS